MIQKAKIVTPKIIKSINHSAQKNWEYWKELVDTEYHHSRKKKKKKYNYINVLNLIIYFSMTVKSCLPHIYSF